MFLLDLFEGFYKVLLGFSRVVFPSFLEGFIGVFLCFLEFSRVFSWLEKIRKKNQTSESANGSFIQVRLLFPFEVKREKTL